MSISENTLPTVLKRRVRKKTPPAQSTRGAPLRVQLRWMRVMQKPYLTQAQLALLARTDAGTISDFETGRRKDIRIQTLRRWVHALGCEISINVGRKPSRAPTAYSLEGPALPAPPKLIRKATAQGRWQAEEYRRLMGKNSPRARRPLPSKDFYGREMKLDPDNPFDFDEGALLPTRHGKR